MPIFTDGDLADFATLAGDLVLKDSCEVLRATKVSDGQGGTTTVWQTVMTVLGAVVDAGSSAGSVQEIVRGQQVTARLRKTILLPRGTAVKGDDRIRALGVTYEIVDLQDPSSYEVLRRVSVWAMK
ncbi:MAG: head-tail adaptor protein [Ktedonobacteraceae bacterium]|nr:head-tail adaptor protein [Ktedonobacteraceae bacterium]